MKRATIQDVADKAGVSRAAVSKVLRNAYGLSADMKARVETAMQQLNYRPQMAARGLRGKSYALGIVLPEFRNPFFADILDGIYEVLEGTEYQPVLGLRVGHNMSETQLIERLMDQKVEGLILVSTMLSIQELRVIAASVPTVLIGRLDSGEGYDTVNSDPVVGANLVVSTLFHLGHRQIAFIGLDDAQTHKADSVTRRQEEYRNAMIAHGIGHHVQIYTSKYTNNTEKEIAFCEDILKRDDRPTAIYAWKDSAALSVMAAASNLGIRVPEDLSVIGFDNNPESSLPQISLSSIDQAGQILGAKSTELLIDRISGRETDQHFIVEPHLVARRSTSVPPHGKT